jgi:uncharacterized protein (DUF952 family)/RimJ/RimL family protein N-acetyltransferase
MISLQPVRAEDADQLFPLIFQSPVTETLVWDGPESLETFRTDLATRSEQVGRGEKHLFTIIEAHSGRPVGSADIRPDEASFRADIGLWIGQSYQGLGYGSAVIHWLVAYGFDQLGLEKIEGYVFCGNLASRRIFEKNGFLLEGTIRNALQKQGQARDEWLFGLTREDYLSSRSFDPSSSAVPMSVEKQPSWLVHLCSQQDWQQAQISGDYRASSLEAVGFIHCSKPSQILKVANHYYPAARELVLLWIDPNKLRSELRWESSDGDIFPHLFGPLNLEAVISVGDFSPDPDGVFRERPKRP